MKHLLIATTLLAAAGCSLPPRDAWRVVRRDGLLTCATRHHNPAVPANRYLSHPPAQARSGSGH